MQSNCKNRYDVTGWVIEVKGGCKQGFKILTRNGDYVLESSIDNILQVVNIPKFCFASFHLSRGNKKKIQLE